MATGHSLEEAAAELGVALNTARKHLKVVFGKTETHRQDELVALLNKLQWPYIPTIAGAVHFGWKLMRKET